MNNRQIRKQLKAESDSHTPDVYDKIKSAAEARRLMGEENGEVIAQGDTAVLSGNRRRTLTAVSVFLAALVIILAIVFPIVFKSPSIPSAPSLHTLSVDDVYGMGAVTTAKLLGQNVPAQTVRALSAVRALPLSEQDAQDGIKANIAKFNEYFTALDSFLGDDVVTTAAEKNTDEKYPFEIKMTITGKNILGNTEEYVMYYTETLTESDDDDEDEGAEKEYFLTGVMVIDGQDYCLEGERSFEKEDGETEDELKIRAYADRTNKSDYIEMKQEVSSEAGESEHEYVYGVYAQGQLVEETAVSLETEREGAKEETEYELEFRSGDAKGKYKVKREIKNGKTKMSAEYEIDGKKGKFAITQQDEKYKYEFADGSSFTF